MTEVNVADPASVVWGLEPGEPIERKLLHAEYGGRTQGASARRRRRRTS